MFKLFKKKHRINTERLNELHKQRELLVKEKFDLEQLIKRKVRYKKDSIEESKYLFAKKKNKNRISTLNLQLNGINLKIEKEKVNQLKEYLFINHDVKFEEL